MNQVTTPMSRYDAHAEIQAELVRKDERAEVLEALDVAERQRDLHFSESGRHMHQALEANHRVQVLATWRDRLDAAAAGRAREVGA